MLSGKRIILGVTGGIAAYKAVVLLRDFQKAGADVRVLMTPNATRFVGSDTFSALSRNDVPVHIFPESHSDSDENWVKHIQWAEWADVMLIAPCTANTLAKIVHGFSDNMITAAVLAARCPVLIAPTMDGEMYHAKVTKRNIALAQELGFTVIEPESGYLASGLEDQGRLPENEELIQAVIRATSGKKVGTNILAGKKVLLTAGPTREFIDPVRFISNPSSGKMGTSMAKAARDFGADVTLFHGPISKDLLPDEVNLQSFETADQLFELIKEHGSDFDIVIMTAAVSDYQPTEKSSKKIKKKDGEEKITFRRTPDSLAWLGEHKKAGQILIGFAMETDNLEQNAKEKIERKNLDWVIANTLNDTDSGFQHDINSVQLFSSDGNKNSFQGLKKDIAQEILKAIFSS